MPHSLNTRVVQLTKRGKSHNSGRQLLVHEARAIGVSLGGVSRLKRKLVVRHVLRDQNVSSALHPKDATCGTIMEDDSRGLSRLHKLSE